MHSEVSDALDAAQQDALSEIRRWLAQHSVTRVGPLGAQEVVPIEQMHVVGITHRTSRAGDPHRHIHMQIGMRVWAAGKWRGLNGAALFKQQGAIRALGTAVIAASPELADVLGRHGLTLDPATGEVAELEPFNAVMSKRGEQVRRNLERLETAWDQAHPGETMGPVVASRLRAEAWAYERPAKKPTTLREEAAWVTELREAGYDPERVERKPAQPPVLLDDLAVQEIASRALDRCAAGASAWTPHTVQEHVTRIATEAGVRAAPAQLREFIALASDLATSDCFSILPPGTATPEHVAHLTSVGVVAAETALRDQLTAATPRREPKPADVTEAARTAGLDAGQTVAAAAVASTDPLVIVEGAAGAGKTTMLGVAIEVAADRGRASRVVAPTLRAAQVAHDELGVPATSVAALVFAHGWRWNEDGVWARLTRGDTDPETGRTFTGPPREARLSRGERVIVDEAGILDQDTAIALLTVTAEAGATVALVGDRAQLAAVGLVGPVIFSVLVTLLSLGLSLVLVVGIGLLFLVAFVYALWATAWLEYERVEGLYRYGLPALRPRRRERPGFGGWLRTLWQQAVDGAMWRGIGSAAIATILGLVVLPLVSALATSLVLPFAPLIERDRAAWRLPIIGVPVRVEWAVLIGILGIIVSVALLIGIALLHAALTRAILVPSREAAFAEQARAGPQVALEQRRRHDVEPVVEAFEFEASARKCAQRLVGHVRAREAVVQARREIPAVAVPQVRRLQGKLDRLGLGGILAIGKPSRPLLEIPVPEGRAGLIVVGGLNPLAAVHEAGIETHNKALTGLVDFTELFDYTELPARLGLPTTVPSGLPQDWPTGRH